MAASIHTLRLIASRICFSASGSDGGREWSSLLKLNHNLGYHNAVWFLATLVCFLPYECSQTPTDVTVTVGTVSPRLIRPPVKTVLPGSASAGVDSPVSAE